MRFCGHGGATEHEADFDEDGAAEERCRTAHGAAQRITTPACAPEFICAVAVESIERARFASHCAVGAGGLFP